MAIINLPIRNDIPAYTQVTELDGTAYTLVFRFNSRSNRWFMDILDESEAPLLEGVKLLARTDLNSRFKSEQLPKGVFIALDQSGRNEEPDRLNFSNDVLLYYAEEAELTALGIET